jgi:hypothetical protein
MSRAPIFMVAKDGRLMPGDAWAAEQVEKLPQGDYFAVLDKIKQDGRNERHWMHGLWFKGLEHLAHNTDAPRYDSQHKAHVNIKLDLGYFVPNLKTGMPMPMSTAIEKMTDEAYIELHERAREFCVKTFGFDPWQQIQDEYAAQRGIKR